MTNIVLVHGAWADGSSWDRVIPLLQQAGHMVTAAQLPLETFEQDCAVVTRLLDAQDGPTVVAGHAYGGAVITGAASRSAQAKALVYVCSMGPAQNERLNHIFQSYPDPGIGQALRTDAAGYLWLDRDRFADVFAADVDPARARILTAVQGPAGPTLFSATLTDIPAWQQLPSWYAISERDKCLSPEGQRFLAERMQATTISLPTSHASVVSQPEQIAELIRAATNVAANDR